MKNIIITETEAFLIEGRISKYEACKPIELRDGTFAIPLEVLKNEKMKDVKVLMAGRFKEVNIKIQVIPKGADYSTKLAKIKNRI